MSATETEDMADTTLQNEGVPLSADDLDNYSEIWRVSALSWEDCKVSMRWATAFGVVAPAQTVKFWGI